MYQRADDRKSHLILNLLSWVDFLRPKYCCFENVRGFLGYGINATQVGPHKIEGGIKMGGLKFVVKAMLAMGYFLVHISIRAFFLQRISDIRFGSAFSKLRITVLRKRACDSFSSLRSLRFHYQIFLSPHTILKSKMLLRSNSV